MGKQANSFCGFAAAFFRFQNPFKDQKFDFVLSAPRPNKITNNPSLLNDVVVAVVVDDVAVVVVVVVVGI